MLVKANGGIVFRVDDKRVDCRIRASSAIRCVHDQRGAEATPLESFVDSQSTDQTRGYRAVMRQPLDLASGQFCEWQA